MAAHHSRSSQLVLLGMTSLGKSTIGAQLATGLSVLFSDAEVSRATGRTAREIVQDDGMEAFREVGERVTLGLLQPLCVRLL